MAILMFAVSGVLLGGAWSMRSQGASRVLVVIMFLLALLALAAGVAWLLPR